MDKKKAGWFIIGFSILIGALRLLGVIENSVTAVLWMLGVIMIVGASAGAQKKRKDKERAQTNEEQS